MKNVSKYRVSITDFRMLKPVDEECLNCIICFDHIKVDDEVIETFCDKKIEVKYEGISVKKKVAHVFHEKCILTWFGAGHLTCPFCRTNLYQKLL